MLMNHRNTSLHSPKTFDVTKSKYKYITVSRIYVIAAFPIWCITIILVFIFSIFLLVLSVKLNFVVCFRL